MGVSLQKGQKIELTQTDQGLNSIRIGLGWSATGSSSEGLLGALFGGSPGSDIDCDTSVFLLDSQTGKLKSKEDVVCFSNLRHSSGGVIHMGGNLIGADLEKEKDSEQILIELTKIPSNFNRLVFVVNIFAARERNQHFGMLKNAYIRLINSCNNEEICRYSLSEDYDGMLAMIFGELYIHQNEWNFSAIGQGTIDNSLQALVDRYR